MHLPGAAVHRLQCLGWRPMLLLARAFERDRHQIAPAHPRLDQAAHRGFARRVEMAGRVQADDALRTQRAVEQIGRDLARRCRCRRLAPAEMPGHQIIGLEHADAFADGQHPLIECQLQRPFRWLTACPEMLLFRQHVIIDVADGQRTAPDQLHHLAHVGSGDGRKPFVALALVQPHRRNEEAEITGRHIG